MTLTWMSLHWHWHASSLYTRPCLASHDDLSPGSQPHTHPVCSSTSILAHSWNMSHVIIIIIIIMIMTHLITAPRPQPTLAQHHWDCPPPRGHRDTGPRSEAGVTATLTPEHLDGGHVLTYILSLNDRLVTDLHVGRGHLMDLGAVGPRQPHHLRPGQTRADLGGRHCLADEVSWALLGAVETSLWPMGAKCRGHA